MLNYVVLFDIPSIEELNRTLRRHGIKATALAKKADVDKTIVSKIINRKYNPSYELMIRLFGALDSLIKGSSRRISDIMVRPVVVCSPEESIPNIISKMEDGGFSQIPVTDRGKFMGMVTERSLMLRMDGDSRAGDVLGSDYAVLEPDSSVESARRALLTCQAIAVVDRGRITGILTKADLLR